MKSLRATLMLLPLAIAAPAMAESSPPNFAELDANTDGRISIDEARADARVADEFLKVDKDRDGYLSVEEFGAAWQ